MLDIFLIFAQNIDCGYTLEPPRFGAKIRKIVIPLHTPVLLYKSGVQGVYITRTCFRDAHMIMMIKIFHRYIFNAG